MTPHIAAKQGEIAETILLPGDPLRAKYIAENFLQNAVQFNQIRNMFGYTGSYKGHSVSVMGTGMGMPSISIYVNELISKYGCKTLIRVGTCGSMQEQVKIRDVILAQAASTDSHINRLRFGGQDFAAIANFDLLYRAYNAAKTAGMKVHVGNTLSSDTFYHDDPDSYKLWARFGVLAVEMEAAALYTLAAKFGMRALCVLTVSDHLVHHQETTPEERQQTFNQMIEVALEAATVG